MARVFDPSMLARTYRDPVAQVSLAVDLIPVFAVVTLGWGAAPLVFLYWLENLIIGAVAIARMLAASVRFPIVGIFGVLFLCAFFVVHYGMFCFAHGTFLVMIANGFVEQEATQLAPMGVIAEALSSGPQMAFFVAAIAAWQAFLFVYDFILKGEFREANPGKEMVAPYGRIVLLHLALFAGMFGALALGDPMLGVLGLILLRAVWGMFLSVRRRMRLDQGSA